MEAQEADIRGLLSSMFDVRPAGGGGAAAGIPPRLALHPRVDAAFPGGVTCSSAEQVAGALAAYSALLSGTTLEVQDVVVSGDSAIVAGEQVITSRLAGAAATAGGLLPASFAATARRALPTIAEARVPTAVALTLGKNDAGDPVVTKLEVAFSLPAALAPHLRPPPYAAAAAKAVADGGLRLLASAGWAAAVAEDAWIAAEAAWRAGGAIGGSALEGAAAPLWAAARRAAAAAWEAARERVLAGDAGWPPRMGGKGGGGGGGGGEATVAEPGTPEAGEAADSGKED